MSKTEVKAKAEVKALMLSDEAFARYNLIEKENYPDGMYTMDNGERVKMHFYNEESPIRSRQGYFLIGNYFYNYELAPVFGIRE